VAEEERLDLGASHLQLHACR